MATVLQGGDALLEGVEAVVDIGGGIAAENAFAVHQPREVLDALAEMLEALYGLLSQAVEFTAEPVGSLTSSSLAPISRSSRSVWLSGSAMTDLRDDLPCSCAVTNDGSATFFQNFPNPPFERLQPFLHPGISVSPRHHFASQYLRKAGKALIKTVKSLVNLSLKAIEVLAQILPLSANLLQEPQGMVLRVSHYMILRSSKIFPLRT